VSCAISLHSHPCDNKSISLAFSALFFGTTALNSSLEGGRCDSVGTRVRLLIQSLLREAGLSQWIEDLDTDKATALLLRMKSCAVDARETGFRLGANDIKGNTHLLRVDGGKGGGKNYRESLNSSWKGSRALQVPPQIFKSKQLN
jgi:hypothetical protein